MIMSASLSAAFWAATKALTVALIATSPAVFGSRPPWEGDLNRVMERLMVDMPLVSGLAEIMKNSKDCYQNIYLKEDDRFILTICDFANDCIHIIDLGGMDSEKVKQWKRWADDTALSVKGEGGQGLGGKAAMINISSEYSTLETVSEGFRTKMGYETRLSGIDRFTPAFFKEDGIDIDNVECDDAYTRLMTFISDTGINTSYWDSWAKFQEVAEERQSYTIITLKGLSDHLPQQTHQKAAFANEIADKLRSDPQLQLTMEQSEVFFFDTTGMPTELSPEYPDEVEGALEYFTSFEDEEVEDPQSEKLFKFTGQIAMRSSKQDMRTTPRLRSLNIIRVVDKFNTVWTIPMGEIHDMPLANRHAFGMIQIEANLGKYSDTKRSGVPDRPVARAISELVKSKVEDFLNQVMDLLSSRTNTADRNQLDNMMDEMQKQLEKLVSLDPVRPVPGDDDDGVKGSLTTEEVTEMFFFGPGNPTSESLILLEGVTKQITPIVRGEMEAQRARVVTEKGVRADARELVELVSSDSSIVEVNGFDLIPHGKGSVVITMRIKPLLSPQHPDAVEASWEMEVSSLSEAPEVTLDPEPEVMNIHSNIQIAGEFSNSVFSSTGSLVNACEQNTGFQIWVEGDAYMLSQFPPIMRTKVLQDSNAEGTIFVRWGPNAGDVVSRTFSTSMDLYEPKTRKTPKGPDGKSGGMAWPQLLRCGKEAPNGQTIEENSEQATLIRTPKWDALGIVWLNPGSRKARALTLNPDTGKQFTTKADQWKYFMHLQFGEMATDFLVEKLAERDYEGRPSAADYRSIRDDVEMNLVAPWYESFVFKKSKKSKTNKSAPPKPDTVTISVNDPTEEE